VSDRRDGVFCCFLFCPPSVLSVPNLVFPQSFAGLAGCGPFFAPLPSLFPHGANPSSRPFSCLALVHFYASFYSRIRGPLRCFWSVFFFHLLSLLISALRISPQFDRLGSLPPQFFFPPPPPPSPGGPSEFLCVSGRTKRGPAICSHALVYDLLPPPTPPNSPPNLVLFATYFDSWGLPFSQPVRQTAPPSCSRALGKLGFMFSVPPFFTFFFLSHPIFSTF